MTDIKELALKESTDMLLQHYYDDGDYASFSVELCTRFLAAYLKEQEPVAWVPQFSWQRSIDAVACKSKRSFDDIPLFLAPPLPAIPDHLCLVPREPTEAMVDASWDCVGVARIGNQFKYIAVAYKAMIAAGEVKP